MPSMARAEQIPAAALEKIDNADNAERKIPV
jgi:hypothetical protein